VLGEQRHEPLAGISAYCGWGSVFWLGALGFCRRGGRSHLIGAA